MTGNARKPAPTLEDLGLDLPVKLSSANPVREQRPSESPPQLAPRPKPTVAVQSQPQSPSFSAGQRIKSLAVTYLAQGMIVGGNGCLTTFLALILDTTVSSGSDRVHNTGLVAEQLVSVVAGTSMTIVGAMLLVAGAALMVAASIQISKEPLTRSRLFYWPTWVSIACILVAVVFGGYLVIGVALAVLFIESLVCMTFITGGQPLTISR